MRSKSLAAVALWVVAGAAAVEVTGQSSSSTPLGTIVGTVVASESGRPLGKARVTVTDSNGRTDQLFADASGEFAFTRPPGRRYSVAAEKTGYLKFSVDLAAGARTDRLVIALPRAGVITGRVLGPFGDAAAAHSVAAFLVTGMEGSKPTTKLVRTVETDDRGEYRISGLAADRYLVGLSSFQNLRPLTPVGTNPIYYPGVEAISDAQVLIVDEGNELAHIDMVGGPLELLRQAQGFPGRTPQPPPLTVRYTGGTATIRGRVVQANGQPVAAVRVGLEGRKPIELNLTASDAQTGVDRLNARVTMDWRPLTADVDGRFEFSDQPEGTYTLTLSGAGFVITKPVENLKVGPNDVVDVGDVVIHRTGAITGRIVDEDGEPVEGVPLTVLTPRFRQARTELVPVGGVRPAVSDDRGRYRIYNLEPGRYVVAAALDAASPSAAVLDRSRYARSYYPGRLNPADATVVTVGWSQEIGEVDIALVRGQTARVSGVALDTDGRPFRGSITLSASGRANRFVHAWPEAPVTPDGSFVFSNVPPGDYVVQAYAPQPVDKGEAAFASAYITVTDRDVTGIRLLASDGSSVKGKITVEGGTSGLAHWFFQAVPVAVDLDRSPRLETPHLVPLRDDWSFEMRGLSGPRLFRTIYTGGGLWTVKAVYANGIEVTDTPVMLGAAAQSISDLEIVVTNQGATLAGEVTSAGARTGAVPVVVFSIDRTRWRAFSTQLRMTRSEAKGRFEISGLPAGSYFVAAVDRLDGDESDGEWQDPAVLDALTVNATPVTLTERQHTTLNPRLIVRQP